MSPRTVSHRRIDWSFDGCETHAPSARRLWVPTRQLINEPDHFFFARGREGHCLAGCLARGGTTGARGTRTGESTEAVPERPAAVEQPRAGQPARSSDREGGEQRGAHRERQLSAPMVLTSAGLQALTLLAGFAAGQQPQQPRQRFAVDLGAAERQPFDNAAVRQCPTLTQQSSSLFGVRLPPCPSGSQ